MCLFTLPVFAENTILVVGDSLSAGHGIDPAQGWVELLKQRLKENHYDYAVINKSVSGDTTSNGLTQLPAALAQYKPVITIIELGGNDGLRGIDTAVIKANLEKMIQLAKNASSQVLVLGVRLPPNYGPEYIKAFHDIFTHLANRKDIAVVPLFLATIDANTDLMQSDGIHPRAAAQIILLNNVWPILQKMLQK